jgi:hypothetical protein
MSDRTRWIATGNTATGFIAIGNVVTGFIAIGNVARGFIAIGNVAVGVIAIGNVGFGVAGGFGATVGLGLVAGSGVLALPVLRGFAGVANAAEMGPLSALLPIAAWLIASFIFQGRRTPPSDPPLTPLQRLRSGEAGEGWIRARAARGPEGALRLTAGRASLDVPASPEVLDALDALVAVAGPRPRVIALLRAEERLRDRDNGGYREAGQRERMLACAALHPAPARVLPWASPADVQWWLGRAWRAGIVVALAGLILQAVLSA